MLVDSRLDFRPPARPGAPGFPPTAQFWQATGSGTARSFVDACDPLHLCSDYGTQHPAAINTSEITMEGRGLPCREADMSIQCDACGVNGGWIRGQHGREWRCCGCGTVTCHSCDGYGCQDEEALTTCRRCGGGGYVTCPKCGGLGFVLVCPNLIAGYN
jgi:hypothetical protein